MTPDKTKQLVLIQGQIEGHRTRTGDNALILTFATQELSPEDTLGVLQKVKKHIYMLLAEAEITSDDVVETLATAPEPPKLPAQKQKEKTESLSKKLRNKLWVLHKAQGGEEADFEAYYTEIMEGLLVWYQRKIDEINEQRG